MNSVQLSAKGISVFKAFYPFTLNEISASDKNFVFINLNYNTVAGLIVDNLGGTGKSDCVDAAFLSEAISTKLFVSVTVDIKKIIVFHKKLCKSIAFNTCEIIKRVVIENKDGGILSCSLI